jgi:hypothetical protein
MWEDLQAHETASLFQTLNSRLPPKPSSTSLPSFDPTQVDAQLRESWGPGVVDPSPNPSKLPSMQTAGFSSTRQYQDAFSTECDPFRNAPSTPPPFSFSSLFGLLGHAIDNRQKIKAFTQKLKEEYQQDRKQAAVDCLFSIPLGGGKFLKEIVDLTLFSSPLSRFTDISQRVDHLADSLNDSYMLFIENTGFSINEDSTSSHLGKETGYWIFPLKGDKPFKIAGEALLPRTLPNPRKIRDQGLRRRSNQSSQNTLH